MPFAPELANGGRAVGKEEVFADAEAEHAAHADGHVAVAAEIVVDLQRVAHRAEPHHAAVRRAGERGVGRVRQEADAVRDQKLLGKAAHEAADASGALLRREDAAVDLFGNVVVLDDGARDQLREEGDVEQKLEEVPRPRLRVPVGVDHIAQALEGEEADADGEHDPGHGEGASQSGVQVAQDKVRVFEYAEDAEIEHDGDGKHRSAARKAPAQHCARHEVDQHRDEKQRQVLQLPEGVEHQTRERQQEVLQPDAPPRQPGQQEYQRQKHKQKNRRTEDHAFPSSLSVIRLNYKYSTVFRA